MSTSYVIVPTPAKGDPVWGDVVQTFESARRSLDGSQCVLKWSDRTKPPTVKADAPVRTKDELFDLDGPEWNEPAPRWMATGSDTDLDKERSSP